MLQKWAAQINTDQNDIALKRVVILMTFVVEDDDKFYPQLFLEKKLLEA